MKIAVRLLVILSLSPAYPLAHQAAGAADTLHTLSSPTEQATWEAEGAVRRGAWRVVDHAWASGGAYVEALGDPKGALEFSFSVERPCAIQVWPVWWRHGERRPSSRFPSPFQPAYGPDVIDSCGGLLYFTAPVIGRVGVVDMSSEKVIKQIEVGGYPTDLLADQAHGTIYVADPKQDRIVVLDAGRQARTAEIPVAGQPWHLALHGDRLFVGCMAGKRVAVIDTTRNAVVREAALPFRPQDIALAGKEKPCLAVSPISLLFDPRTLKETAPDRFSHVFTRRRGVMVPIPKNPEAKRVGARPNTLVTRVLDLKTRSWVETEIDVREITESRKVLAQFSPPLYDLPGPDILDKLDTTLFFTSPAAGKVGVFDMIADRLLGVMDLGGYLSDLVVHAAARRVYVSDALGNRVVVLDPDARTVLRSISVPETPLFLSLHRNRLFVTCCGAKCVAVIDTAKQAQVRTISLPFTPLQADLVRLDPPYAFSPYPASEPDAPLCLAIRMPSLALDAESLAPLAALPPAVQPRKRNEAAVSGKRVTAENTGVLRVDEKRLIDVVPVMDPQALPAPPPLSKLDRPGTITVSMDGMPALDWRRDIWVTPDHERFLLNGTDEFWQWNAPRFNLRPGRHVLKIARHSPFARLDAIKVALSPVGDLALDIEPEPRSVHGAIALPPYQGVFYYDEPVRLRFVLRNLRREPRLVRIAFTVSNYLDQPELRGEMEVALSPLDTWRGKPVELPVKEFGVFALNAVVHTDTGRMLKEHHFLRLPRLEHPRLLFRADEVSAIRARIARYPRLFKRYTEWLRRQCENPKFLPPTLSPKYMSIEYHDIGSRWRAVACEFAALFLDPAHSRYFSEKAAPLLQKRTNLYETYHQSRFGGALACLFDMAAARSGDAAPRIPECFAESLGVSEFLAESLLVLAEPLDAEERAILNQQMLWLVNVDQYFSAHAGRHGGNWWLSLRTGCGCPLNSFGESFLFYRNVFGEKNVFSRPFFPDTYTHHQYVHPLHDKRNFFYAGGLSGGPIRWAVGSLTRQPVEKYRNGFDRWIVEMNGRMPQPDRPSVDTLMRKDFALTLPLFLALGWYDPAAPEVAWEELPPSALFDVEGEAAMKSDWGDDSTTVYFCCGVRDVAYHNQPGHFEIMKAGEVLIGSASLTPEDGSPAPSWGNVVVTGDEWPLRWKANVGHPRMGEFTVLDRTSPASLYYALRDYAHSGFCPPAFLHGGPGPGWYGTRGFYRLGQVLGFHGHSQHPFINEGEILAYETRPEFDYVAGDATNAWPVDQVAELYRQLVFLRNDVIVIYDRGVLGPRGALPCWLAATGPTLTLDRNNFTVQNGYSRLHSQVLVPAKANLKAFDSVTDPKYGPLFFQGQKVRQRVLEVREDPASRRPSLVEFLTVMNVGIGSFKPIPAALRSVDSEQVSVGLSLEDKEVALRFRRTGPVGGRIRISGGAQPLDQELVQRIDDSYHHWSNDPGYPKWTADPRFRFIRPSSKRK